MRTSSILVCLVVLGCSGGVGTVEKVTFDVTGELPDNSDLADGSAGTDGVEAKDLPAPNDLEDVYELADLPDTLPGDADAQPCDGCGDVDVTAHCLLHEDCPMGFACDPEAMGEQGDGCVPANECQVDSDCPEGESCELQTNWLECRPAFTGCSSDDSCPYGFVCVVPEEGTGACVPANECTAQQPCAEDFV